MVEAALLARCEEGEARIVEELRGDLQRESARVEAGALAALASVTPSPGHFEKVAKEECEALSSGQVFRSLLELGCELETTL